MPPSLLSLLPFLLLSLSPPTLQSPPPPQKTKKAKKAKALSFASNASSAVLDIHGIADYTRLAHSLRETFVVLFYDDREIHSAPLIPLWESVAAEMAGFATAAAVNVANRENTFLVNAWGIETIPSVRTLGPYVEGKKNGTDGRLAAFAGRKGLAKYQGRLGGGEIRKAVLSALTTAYVGKPKTLGEYESFVENVENGKVRKVVLLTGRNETTDLYKGLSVRFHHRLDFAEVNLTSPLGVELAHRHGELATEETTPLKTTLFVLVEGEKKKHIKHAHLYNGAYNMQDISAFLEPYARDEKEAESWRWQEWAKVMEAMKARAAKPFVNITGDRVFRSEFVETTTSGLSLVGFFNATALNENMNHKILHFFLSRYVGGEAKEEGVQLRKAGWVSAEDNEELMRFLGVKMDSVVAFNAEKQSFASYEGEISESSLSSWMDDVTAGRVTLQPFDKSEMPSCQYSFAE